MIRYHNKGKGSRPSYDDIAGRIVLIQNFTDWGGVKKPVRVTSDSGRGVVGFELARTFDNDDKRWVYSDESDTRSDVLIDKSAIRASCDTASEAMAMLEVSAAADAAILAARKLAEARLKALEGKELPAAADVRLLAFDEWDEWVNPKTGKTLLTIREEDR